MSIEVRRIAYEEASRGVKRAIYGVLDAVQAFDRTGADAAIGDTDRDGAAVLFRDPLLRLAKAYPIRWPLWGRSPLATNELLSHRMRQGLCLWTRVSAFHAAASTEHHIGILTWL